MWKIQLPCWRDDWEDPQRQRGPERVPLMDAMHTGGLSWTLLLGQAPR